MANYTEKEKTILKQCEEGPFHTLVTELTNEEFDALVDKLISDNYDKFHCLVTIYRNYNRNKLIDYYIAKGDAALLLGFLDYCNDFATEDNILDLADIAERIIQNNNQQLIDDIIKEFTKFLDKGILAFGSFKPIYIILRETQSPVDISLYVDKEPYIAKLTDDNVINLTGQSGSGKTTYANEHFNSDEYLVIDTDDIFSDNRFATSKGINRELGEYFRSKYQVLPNCGDDFDLIYKEILDYCSKYDKTIVIDCAQFHCIKDISLLKGTLIVIRTSIKKCYERTIERFKTINPNYTEAELSQFREKKKAIYKWYKYTNKFLEQIDEMSQGKNFTTTKS